MKSIKKCDSYKGTKDDRNEYQFKPVHYRVILLFPLVT